MWYTQSFSNSPHTKIRNLVLNGRWWCWDSLDLAGIPINIRILMLTLLLLGFLAYHHCLKDVTQSLFLYRLGIFSFSGHKLNFSLLLNYSLRFCVTTVHDMTGLVFINLPTRHCYINLSGLSPTLVNPSISYFSLVIKLWWANIHNMIEFRFITLSYLLVLNIYNMFCHVYNSFANFPSHTSLPVQITHLAT